MQACSATSTSVLTDDYNPDAGFCEMGQEKECVHCRFKARHTLLSDSVGSTMSVPGTGHDMVGAWKP